MWLLRATIIAAWALLIGAWIVGNPPLAAPDERDHYVRALGIVEGDLLGRPAPEAAGGKTPRQVAWIRQSIRSVRVNEQLVPPADCYVFEPAKPAGCMVGATGTRARELATPVANYQPLPYLLAAPATGGASSALGALRAARVPGALLSLLLLAVAALAMRSASSLLGLLAAVTPMVLFCAAAISGSGAEIAAGVAVSAAVIRLAQERSPPRWLWPALGFSGAVLVLSRSPGAIWVLLLLLLPVALAGFGRSWAKLREGGAIPWVSLAVIAVAIAGNRTWETLYGPSISPVTESPGYGLRLAAEQWWTAMPDLVGKFGYLEFSLPLWIPLAWAAVVSAILVVAWRCSSGRNRKVLAGTFLVALLLPLVVYVGITRQSGFGLQGRHVLPVIVALPILAGALLPDRAVSMARIAPAAGAIMGFVQFAAVWFNARRSAVGIDGPVWFLSSSEWAPPGGWAVALVPAGLGCVAIVAAGVSIGRLARTTPRAAWSSRPGQECQKAAG